MTVEEILKHYSDKGLKIENVFLDNHGTVNIKSGGEIPKAEKQPVDDEQIARALEACVGKDKVINQKQKWAGAYWYLRWVCNFPANTQKFCDKVNALPFEMPLEIECDYRNIRELATLSFMDQDPCKMASVKPSKNDEKVFWQCREVALELAEILEK